MVCATLPMAWGGGGVEGVIDADVIGLLEGHMLPLRQSLPRNSMCIPGEYQSDFINSLCA